jgi:hypothetical protein
MAGDRSVRPVDVVVLSRYPDIFQGFKDSVDKDALKMTKFVAKFVVWDHRVEYEPETTGRWAEIMGHAPFSMARNANLGWQGSPDILYCGDDVRFIEPDTIKRLQEAAYSDYSIGIVSPMHGWHKPNHPYAVFQWNYFVPFVCVYIKRSLIDHIGYLDESFEGYGCEDLDYCIRARKAGAKIGWAPQIRIQHAEGDAGFATTFRRSDSEQDLRKQDEVNRLKLCENHGFPKDVEGMWEAIKKL